jgi:hypothetical protein
MAHYLIAASRDCVTELDPNENFHCIFHQTNNMKNLNLNCCSWCSLLSVLLFMRQESNAEIEENLEDRI